MESCLWKGLLQVQRKKGLVELDTTPSLQTSRGGDELISYYSYDRRLGRFFTRVLQIHTDEGI